MLSGEMQTGGMLKWMMVSEMFCPKNGPKNKLKTQGMAILERPDRTQLGTGIF
jgi:hypothetical protein